MVTIPTEHLALATSGCEALDWTLTDVPADSFEDSNISAFIPSGIS
jgi:hypothetical protein